MKFIKLIFLTYILISLQSCTNNKKHEAIYNANYRNDSIENVKKKIIQQHADSTVNLSFYGIELGKPLNSTINKGKKSGLITSIKFNETIKYKAAKYTTSRIKVPLENNVVETDMHFISINDTIATISIDFDYEREIVEKIYKDKYGEDYIIASSEDNTDSSGEGQLIKKEGWHFKNQKLVLHTELQIEQALEIYVKDYRLRDSSPNKYGTRTKANRYITGFSVSYIDNYHYNKYVQYIEKCKREEREKELKKEKEEIEKAQINNQNFSNKI